MTEDPFINKQQGQRKFCKDNTLIHLVPVDGICQSCDKYIWGMITSHVASTEYIYSCPFCGFGFKDYKTLIKKDMKIWAEGKAEPVSHVAAKLSKHISTTLQDEWDLESIASQELCFWIYLELKKTEI